MEFCYDPNNSKNRWIGYFDLLGTSNAIRAGMIYQVFAAYQTAIRKLDSWKQRHSSLFHLWFSDTFIIYSGDDSRESFEAIEIICRWFVFSLIHEKIPVRGALACGDFYVDQSNRIFLGSALLEAYECGENQDWLGFILTPSSVMRLAEVGLPIKENIHYCNYEIPFKKKPLGGTCYAVCILNCVTFNNGESPLTNKLSEMMKNQSDERVKKKYEHTISFIAKNRQPIKANS